MSSPKPVTQDCPKCKRATARRHCETHTCTWWKCSNCKITFDARTGKAMGAGATS